MPEANACGSRNLADDASRDARAPRTGVNTMRRHVVACLVFICVASTATTSWATIRFFPDLVTQSPNGRYRVEARSRGNQEKHGWVFDSGFNVKEAVPCVRKLEDVDIVCRSVRSGSDYDPAVNAVLPAAWREFTVRRIAHVSLRRLGQKPGTAVGAHRNRRSQEAHTALLANPEVGQGVVASGRVIPVGWDKRA